MFRRRKIATNGIDLFRQEYPAEPEEAFLTTGRPVFNPEQLQVCLEEARDVKERLALEGDEWINNRRGELTTYLDHDEGERYVIGADPSMGLQPGTTQLPRYSTPKSDKSQRGEGTSTPTILQRFCITWGLTTTMR